MSETTYYSARPVVKVDGTEEAEVGDELLGLLVEETQEGLARCELRVSNWGLKDGETTFLFFDRQVLDFGRELSVEVGPPGKSGEVFKGRITALEGIFPMGRPPELVVLAEDRLQDLRMTRRTRSWEEVSDADVVQEIVQDHGLTAQVDAQSPTYGVLTQVNQSDLAFLRERARATGAMIWLDGETLHFVDKGQVDRGSVEMTYGRELRELDVLADLAHQRTAWRVGGWDVSAKEGVTEEADAGVLSGEVGSQEGGGDLLQQAFGARTDHVAHWAAFSSAEALGLAEARYREGGRRFVSGTAEAEGDGRIRVGWTVELDGVGVPFDGAYQAVEVRHGFDGERGYRVGLHLERPGVGA